ncbi:hypothetical protein BGZ99_010281 [Dissophora globulifera]|uniref:Uncharacterized protein n=1 Tax=Dissophora globulifera TaxID=979702 RepID=A0A9P6R2D0_9FUNG|nr:hypothetical protein BGZ99_010281 [Dissophora globulifera]
MESTYALFVQKDLPPDIEQQIRLAYSRSHQEFHMIIMDGSHEEYTAFLTNARYNRGAYFVYKEEYVVVDRWLGIIGGFNTVVYKECIDVVRFELGVEFGIDFRNQTLIVPIEGLYDVMVTLYVNRWWGDFEEDLDEDGVYTCFYTFDELFPTTPQLSSSATNPVPQL